MMRAPSSFVRAIAAAGLLVGLFGPSGRAFAHPDVDEARALYQQADFPGALAALARAEAANDLTRAELLEHPRDGALARPDASGERDDGGHCEPASGRHVPPLGAYSAESAGAPPGESSASPSPITTQFLPMALAR